MVARTGVHSEVCRSKSRNFQYRIEIFIRTGVHSEVYRGESRIFQGRIEITEHVPGSSL